MTAFKRSVSGGRTILCPAMGSHKTLALITVLRIRAFEKKYMVIHSNYIKCLSDLWF